RWMMSETTRGIESLPRSPHRSDDPARRLWLLWRKGERPDVRSFLEGAGPLAPVQVVAVLRVDQRERWAIGERIDAATYLRDYPPLHEDPEAAVELAYCEFLLREERGESPDLQEYLDAYPEYGPRLELQVGLHLALKPNTEIDLAGESAR